jgi:hypothetical protein
LVCPLIDGAIRDYDYRLTGNETVETYIYFDDNDEDLAGLDFVRITYKRRVANSDRVTVQTTSTTAKGSFWAHWPVYSSGSDCTQSNQKGMLHLYIPRCRVTQLPGFDSSYKNAQTFGITVSAIDPKRSDKKLYELGYESLIKDTNP